MDFTQALRFSSSARPRSKRPQILDKIAQFSNLICGLGGDFHQEKVLIFTTVAQLVEVAMIRNRGKWTFYESLEFDSALI